MAWKKCERNKQSSTFIFNGWLTMTLEYYFSFSENFRTLFNRMFPGKILWIWPQLNLKRLSGKVVGNEGCLYFQVNSCLGHNSTAHRLRGYNCVDGVQFCWFMTLLSKLFLTPKIFDGDWRKKEGFTVEDTVRWVIKIPIGNKKTMAVKNINGVSVCSVK